MTHKEKALNFYFGNLLCSQAVFAAFAKEIGISEDDAIRIATPLGSGMRKGEVCGAVSGALMVIGGLYGQRDKNDPNDRLKSNYLTEEFMKRFKEDNTSCICKELLKCDISTSEGKKIAMDNHLFGEVCPMLVASAVDILEELINEQKVKELKEQ